MAYRVNRFDAHSTNLVAGPFAEFLDAHTEYLNLRRYDPRGQYDIRTHDGTLVDIAAALGALEPVPVPAPVSAPPEEASLDIHVFHADDTSSAESPLPLSPESEPVITPVVIPPDAPAPTPPSFSVKVEEVQP